MIVNIKYPKNISLQIIGNNTALPSTNSKLSDDCIVDEYKLENYTNFDIVITSECQSFNTILFRKKWINGIKWSFISVDWIIKKQSWRIDFEYLGKTKGQFAFNIKSKYLDNYYNGYAKKYELSIQNQKNARIKIQNTTHIKLIDVFLMYLFIFLNQIPLIFLIITFFYIDIVHPDWFKSGLFSIFIHDIPLSILLIINTSIAICKIRAIIMWMKT